MNRPRLALFLMTSLLAACTGAPGQPTGQPTVAPTGSPAAGGWDVQDPCGLATIEEVSTALGMDVVTAEEQVGDTTTYCNYRTADGTSVMATSFSRGETFVFDSFAASEGAIPVPGIGEAAVFTNGSLFIKSGDAVVGVQPSVAAVEGLDDEEIIQTISAIAQAIAARL